MALDNIKPKSIKPAGNSLNAGLAFRLKKFSPLVLPLDKRINVHRPKRSKSNEALIVPAISSLKLNRYKPATADMTERVKRFTRKPQKKAAESESLENISIVSLKELLIEDVYDNEFKSIIDDVDVEDALESSDELNNFQEKIGGNDQDSTSDDQKESVHDESAMSSLIGTGMEISQEKANSDIGKSVSIDCHSFLFMSC